MGETRSTLERVEKLTQNFSLKVLDRKNNLEHKGVGGRIILK
jgi:hypothetical protein